MSVRSRSSQRATAMAPSAGNAGAKSATHASHMGSWVWHHTVVPTFHTLLSLIRAVTSVHASLSFCLMLLALVACLAGLSTLGALGLARHYTHVKSVITRPLEFDYSQPVAAATVDLRDPPVPPRPFLAIISDFLGYTEPVYDMYEGYHQQHHQQLASRGSSDSADPRVFTHAAAAREHQNSAAYASAHERSGSGGGGGGGLSHSKQSSPPPEWLRAVRAGQAVSVDVVLELPPNYRDLYQVTVILESLSGQSLSRATRTHMARPSVPVRNAIRNVLTLPLLLLGGGHGTTRTSLRLINKYVERLDSPMVYAHVLLASRNATSGTLPPPPVYSGQIIVRIHLGFRQQILHWLSPSLVTSLVVGSVATAVALGSGVAAMALLVLTWALHRLKSHATARRNPEHERLSQELAYVIRDTRALLEEAGSGYSNSNGVSRRQPRLTAPPRMHPLVEEPSDDDNDDDADAYEYTRGSADDDDIDDVDAVGGGGPADQNTSSCSTAIVDDEDYDKDDDDDDHDDDGEVSRTNVQPLRERSNGRHAHVDHEGEEEEEEELGDEGHASSASCLESVTTGRDSSQRGFLGRLHYSSGSDVAGMSAVEPSKAHAPAASRGGRPVAAEPAPEITGRTAIMPSAMASSSRNSTGQRLSALLGELSSSAATSKEELEGCEKAAEVHGTAYPPQQPPEQHAAATVQPVGLRRRVL